MTAESIVGSARRARLVLPRGRTLPAGSWARRHCWLLRLLWLHLPAIMAFGLAQGYPLAHVLVDTAVPAAFAVAALALGRHRRPASAAVALGLLTCSAIVTHLSGGYIEAHFHFFVIVSLLVLYEDWQPFLLAIGYVLAHHGVMGALDSAGVYNHAGGAADPWKWAGIHAGFIAALSIGSVVSWRLNEDARAESDSAHAETKAALAQATESEQRFRSALESAPIGMALIEPDPRSFGRFRRVNRALCEMTGYSEQELLARDFQSITHPDDLADNLADADALLSGALERYETEKRYLHADGRVIWALVRSSLIPNRDGTPAVFISQMQDITQRKKIEAELSHHALHDSLTGLPNRALFLDRLAQASLHAQPRDGAVGVLFLDLDNFKLVNDTYGHRVGDAVLKAVAERLRGALGHQDTIARFGGDEFAVLCDGSAAARDLSATAARLGETIAAPLEIEGRALVLTASIGIVSDDGEPRDPDALLRDADTAMYRAKASGRGRWQIFNAQLREEVVRRLELEHALRDALARDQFELHYQPIVDLETGRVEAIEALVRWQHPERGLVSPADFIPIAEDTGLIVELGEWVLREACTEAAGWFPTDGASPPRVAVNISPRQLADPDLVLAVTMAIAESGLDASRLSLEITESAVMEDFNNAAETILILNRLGIEIALDDFGTGHSSLAQLRRLPPLDVLKIDRAFIADIEHDPHAHALVAAVISMARSLELVAVAEGVETAQQLAILRSLGCPLAQGYLFARPQPAALIQALLSQGHMETAGPETSAPSRARTGT